MKSMKEGFLTLVEETQKAGIEAISVTSFKRLRKSWKRFWESHADLILKIKEWGSTYRIADSGPIFEDGERTENPLIATAVIKILSSELGINEKDLYENEDDLAKDVEEANGNFHTKKFAKKLAREMYDNYICDINAKMIFSKQTDEM